VAEDVRVVTLSWRAVAAIVVLVLVLTVALVASVVPDGGKAPLGNKADGNKAERTPGGVSGWSDLGVGALVGALVGAVGSHVLRERAQDKREAREMLGLLRMLYVEIETNRGETELLLNAKNPKAGLWTGAVYKDDTWKEARSRLTLLMHEADHFKQLVAYYVRNDAQERGISKVIEMGSSFRNPDNVLAKLMAEKLAEQKDLAIAALEMIKGYIGEPPVGRESVEDAEREMERLQGELDAEEERRKLEQEQ
jgi:hypothetical protein